MLTDALLMLTFLQTLNIVHYLLIINIILSVFSVSAEPSPKSDADTSSEVPDLVNSSSNRTLVRKRTVQSGRFSVLDLGKVASRRGSDSSSIIRGKEHALEQADPLQLLVRR